MYDPCYIEDKVKEAIKEVLPAIPDDCDLCNLNLFNLGLDSINTVQLVLLLEQTCGIEFPMEEITYEGFASVPDIINTIIRIKKTHMN